MGYNELIEAWSISGDKRLLPEIDGFLTFECKGDMTLYRGFSSFNELSYHIGEIILFEQPASWTDSLVEAEMFSTLQEQGHPIIFKCFGMHNAEKVSGYSKLKSEHEYLSKGRTRFQVDNIEHGKDGTTIVSVHEKVELYC